jgi:hypothetical protein
MKLAHLRLVRLEPEHRRRAERRVLRLAPERLRDRAGPQREVRRQRVVVVVRIRLRVREDHLRLELAHQFCQLQQDLLVPGQRVVALVQEVASWRRARRRPPAPPLS